MKGERALQYALEILLHRVLPDLHGEALQHLWKITELVQHHREHQLGLVLETVGGRARPPALCPAGVVSGGVTQPRPCEHNSRSVAPMSFSLWSIAGERELTRAAAGPVPRRRSEEHTSELQSLPYL